MWLRGRWVGRYVIEGSFRPKSLGLYRPTINVITVTFFVFLRFFEKRDFTFFCFASHVFSYIMVITIPAGYTTCINTDTQRRNGVEMFLCDIGDCRLTRSVCRWTGMCSTLSSIDLVRWSRQLVEQFEVISCSSASVRLYVTWTWRVTSWRRRDIMMTTGRKNRFLSSPLRRCLTRYSTQCSVETSRHSSLHN